MDKRLNQLYDEHQAEMNDEDNWKDKIKDRCFICEKRLFNDFRYYKMYGNCCMLCSGRITAKSKKIGK